MKVLHCRELGFDCEAVVRAESEVEILRQAAEHAQAVHQFAVTPEVAEMAKGLIKEEA